MTRNTSPLSRTKISLGKHTSFAKGLREPLHPLHLIIDKSVRGLLVLRNLSGGRQLIRRWFLKGLSEHLHPLHQYIDKNVRGLLVLRNLSGSRQLIRQRFPKSFSEPLDPLHLIIDKSVRGILVFRNLSGSDAQGRAGSAKPKARANTDGGVRLARTLGARARSIPATCGLVTCNL